MECVCGVRVTGEEGCILGGEDTSSASAEVDGFGVDVVNYIV